MCALTFAASPLNSARAGSWFVAPEVNLSAGRDGNVRLSPIDEVESDFAVLRLKGEFTRKSEALELSLIPQATLVRYDEQSVLNRDDYGATANGRVRFERGEGSIATTYVRDTTLTSEFGSSGYTESAKRHESLSASMSANWMLGERWSASGQSTWSAHDYEGSAVSLVDYDYGSAAVRTAYSVGERSTFSLQTSFGRLWVPTQQRHSDNYAVSAGWQHSMFENWKMSADVGPARVDAFGYSENGLGYSVGVERSAERNNVRLTASRDVTPTGRGVLSKREQVLIGMSKSIGERVGATLSAQWGRNQDLVPTLGPKLGSLRFMQIESGAQWLVTPTIGAFVSLVWLRQEIEDLGTAKADAFRGSFGIRWQGLRRDFQ